MPTVKPPVEMVLVAVVDVALKFPNVGVLVEINLVPSNESKVLLE